MNADLAREKAAALNIPTSYGSYDAMLADPAIQVVHNATPNFLHYPVNSAIIAKGKHCLLYTSPSPRDRTRYRMPSSA